MPHPAVTRRSSPASVRRNDGWRRWPGSTHRSSSAGTRTCSSTGASAPSASSTPAASACRTSTSPARTGRCSARMSSSAGRTTRRATSPAAAGRRSGRLRPPKRRRSSSRNSPVNAPETVVVGRVGKSHGLDGSFIVEGASEAAERFEVGAELLVAGEPAKVLAAKQARGRPLIRLDRRVPRGAVLEVRRESLAPAGEGEYYVFELVVGPFSYRCTTPLRAGQVDDEPYGGGAGMVLRVDVVASALDAVYGGAPEHRVVALSPQGRQLTQDVVEELAGEERLTLLSARFEGFDERVVQHLASDAISIGPYVLSNGDLPAMVLLDAIARRLPGAIREESGLLESFSAELEGGLEYPHYTRPPDFRGWRVPEVLLSGDHGKIEEWRREQSRKRTVL